MTRSFLFLSIILFLVSSCTNSQILDHSWKHIVYSNDREWFATEEAKAVAENVLLYQRNIGGWPKNTQMQKPLSESEKKELKKVQSNAKECTTDNGATVLEMNYLSKMYDVVKDERYKQAFIEGVNYLLEAQYENGGWPQFYPLKKGYYTHITYNDDSMVNILKLLEDLFKHTNKYSIVPDSIILNKTKIAFDKGIECIIKTQYLQNGILTGWCAQHDELTFEPAKARAYELPSLSGQESAGIVQLLMTIDQPSPEIIKAVNSAVAWFERTKITGIRIERYKNEDGKGDKRIIEDSSASPVWARFMELNDNTPFFCDRDGIKKSSLMDIGQERRNGYRWYSDQPQGVLDAYPTWHAKWSNLKP